MDHPQIQSRTWFLTLGALGVVYGDIGTNAIFTFREIFNTPGLDHCSDHIFGALSLMTWALLISVTAKYVLSLLRVDNQGEGGIMALLALALRRYRSSRAQKVLIVLGMMGAALFMGDCVVTPAMSVLSAVEGLALIAPTMSSWVVPISVGILLGLFIYQKRGTAKVGSLFGPVMVIWFICLGVMGLVHLARAPQVLMALSPWYGIKLFWEHPSVAFWAMASVVLVITGGEALYSDMGHFGLRPIRRAWFLLVLPCLLLNYMGQGALCLLDPRAFENPFFMMVPGSGLIPLTILATIATVIASQSVISGAYSLCRQAVNLGYFPRLKISHTSADESGQIYVGSVNWILCAGVLLAMIGFGSSSALAGAYGLAVSGNMVITSVVALALIPSLWNWSPWKAWSLFGFFGLLDTLFLSANFSKIPNGGWFPLALGSVILIAMWTWYRGRIKVNETQKKATMPLHVFLDSMASDSIKRVEGTAIFLCNSFDTVPRALIHNLYHNKILHQQICLVKLETQDCPLVPQNEQMQLISFEQGFYGISINHGYMELPNLVRSLKNLEKMGLKLPLMQTSFFVTHQNIVPKFQSSWSHRLKVKFFILMMRNSPSLTDFLRLPPNRVIVVGSEIEI